jgi:hypothetical protein
MKPIKSNRQIVDRLHGLTGALEERGGGEGCMTILTTQCQPQVMTNDIIFFDVSTIGHKFKL